jgi:hypothetical protein
MNDIEKSNFPQKENKIFTIFAKSIGKKIIWLVANFLR